ncbi:MAG TPA: RluA family pseudouridine synthase [Malonomonas sp.]
MNELIVEKAEENLSAAEFLQRRLPAAPPAYLKQLLKKGKIRGPRGALAADDRLNLADRIQLPDSGRLQELQQIPLSAATEVSILYESREILVVDKPAGLAIHASVGHEDDNLTSRVEALLKKRGSSFQVAPVHRLDLETSGPVLFGKGKQACGQLGQLFIRQEVDKCYLALVVGMTPGSGELQSQLSAKGKLKDARSRFRACQRNEQASLLELTLLTGRQHQIRRQLAEIGHPLFGDKRYQGPCPAELPRLFLHCSRLAFVDPFNAAPIAIDCPLPADLAQFLPRIGME